MSDGAAAATSAAAWGLVPAVLVVAAVGLVLAFVVAVLDRAVVHGPRGALVQPLRAGVKLLAEQRRTTLAPDSLLWRLGSASVPVLALLSLAVVPLGGRALLSTSADLVWFNAMEAVLWAAVWLVGWGPNSLYPLTGGYRFLIQGLAYELPLMFSIITVAVGAGSLRVTDAVAAQSDLWFVVTMPVAFVVFLLSAAGFAFWGPLSAPAGADIAGGVMAELSGVERLLVDVGRAALLGAASVMATAVFLGGGQGPWLPGPVWEVVKAVVVVLGLVVIGRRWPVVRPERFVEVGWMLLIPATLLQALVVALLALAGFYG